jgi:uncharacterized protein (TIGR03435 family)
MKPFLRGVLALLVCLSAASSFSQFVTKAAPKVGDLPPMLQLGQIIQGPSLNEISWGKLNTQCGPCIQAIPHLNELADKFSQKPVVFLSISDDNSDHLKQFLQKRPIKSWLALDGPFGHTKDAFGVEGIPTTFIVDKSGKIAAIAYPANLQSVQLDEILAGRPSSLPIPKSDADDDNQPTRETDASSNQPPTEVTVSINGPFPAPSLGPFDSRGWNQNHTIFEAEKAYAGDAIASFLGVNRKLVVEKTKLPEGLYDITAIAPTNKWLELQMRFAEMVKTNLGISVQLTNREMDVYAMTSWTTNAPGLRLEETGGGGETIIGGFRSRGSMDLVASYFENYFDKPVVNETKLTGAWGVDVKWKMSEEELLPFQLNKEILQFIETNSKAIISGELPQGLRDKITSHDLKLLQTELAKPEDRQFQPNPTSIIKAAREQVGLNIRPTRRMLQVVEIHAVQ